MRIVAPSVSTVSATVPSTGAAGTPSRRRSGLLRLSALPVLAMLALMLTGGDALALFRDAQLDRDLKVFEVSLRKKQGRGTRREARNIWRTAERLWRARRYRAARPLYERAAGLGLRSSALWQQYSFVLGVGTPRRYGAARLAAYKAYKLAAVDRDKAQSLYLLGFWSERLNQPKKALALYEEAVSINDHRAAKKRAARLAALYRQMIVKTRGDNERDQPRLCLTFSQPLPKGDPAALAPYIAIEPRIKPAFSVVGRDLCIGGVAHGTTYRVTVREGLPSTKDDLKTLQTRTVAIAIANRKPRVGFRGKAFILPRTSRQGIPFTSINISQVQMRVLRINDRGLVDALNRGNINALLSGYDISRVINKTGEEVWRGSVAVEKVENREVTTAVPMRQVLKDPKPGIYVVVATDKKAKKQPRYKNWATQWVVVTDLAISTYAGSDGLHVFVRSYDSAQSVAGATVRLVARNNKILGTAKSDDSGRVTFAPGLVRGKGGNAPAAVYVSNPTGEFNFLNLTRPGFDLSDRGVGGRSAPGPIDAFLQTERGIYRPGATVYLTSLIRDSKGQTLKPLPLTVKLIRPDGVEARRFLIKADDRAGGATLKIPLSKASRTGTWRLQAYVDPKGPIVGSASFQVEDFVPERLTATVKPAQPVLVPGKENAVTVNARYLYGAPAADLAVEATLSLQIDRAPFDAFKSYQFGLIEEKWSARLQRLKAARTDAKGVARLPISLSGKPDTSLPLKAVVRLSVIEPGGRAFQRLANIPVRSADTYVGVKLADNSRRVAEGAQARFSVVALGADGKRKALTAAQYKVLRETYRYVWYFQNGRWNYRVIQRSDVAKTGTVDIGADAPAQIATGLEPGRYRVEVRDPASGAAASTRFYVGWTTTLSANNTPDRLAVALDKKNYQAGDTAKLSIKAPFDGVAHIVVASDRIHLSRTLNVTRAGTTLDLAVKKDWGPGVYVMATAYRPMNKQAKRGPSRAIGLTYLALDMRASTLDVSLKAPVMIRPRGAVDVAVKVAGAKTGEKVFVTLAAVDEGILQLTRFRSPAPSQYFFGKRYLKLKIRDDYGRLIDAYAGRLGKVRVGGDATADRFTGGLDASSIKTVSLFSGLVEVDASGTARVRLNVPDFNGRLRLMAMAWSRSSVGEAESHMVVRDPVVSIVTLPRFLAPGDRGDVTVSLDNVDGPAGAYKMSLTANGTAVAAGPKASQAIKLTKKGRYVGRFSLIGKTPGVANISIKLSGPDGFAIVRSWPLTVRPAQVAITTNKMVKLASGAKRRLLQNSLAGYLPGTTRVYLSAGRVPDLGVPGMLRSLEHYPYSCAEQTTSKALPLLYLSKMAQTLGLATDDTAVRARVQGAIYRVLNRQNRRGGFGLWSAYGASGGWLSAYIMDFLTQAKKQGYTVPDIAMSNGLDRLQNFVRTRGYSTPYLPVHTYALYVLAKNKKTSVADIRYLYETYRDRLPTALSKAQLGAALALYGDTARATTMFAAARAHKSRPVARGAYWRTFVRDYGSYLRDRSGVLYLTAATQPADKKDIDALLVEVSQLRRGTKYLSTQEQAWLLLAAQKLSGQATPFTLSLAGQSIAPRSKTLYRRYADKALRRGVTVQNTGKGDVWIGTTVVGIPKRDLPAEASGFDVSRVFYTLDGKRADLTRIKQSDVLVALIRVRPKTRVNHQALLVDLLPAGFEIENPRLGAQDVRKMKWLPKLRYTRNTEVRDDRYVAAIDIGRKNRDFYVAYLVRAVTPGTFRLPAAYIEDMYSPNYRGRGVMDTVKILPRR